MRIFNLEIQIEDEMYKMTLEHLTPYSQNYIIKSLKLNLANKSRPGTSMKKDGFAD